MKIGNVKLDSKLILAPMAGVNCAAFRLLCKENGSGLVTTAMIYVDSLVAEPEKLIKMTCFLKKEKPIAVQLVGSKPDMFKKATKIIEPYADIIDINLGCPSEDIVDQNSGSYFTRYPENIPLIVKPVIDNTNKPVTAKIRLGYNKPDTLNIIKILSDLDLSAIAIHARTINQGYSGKADWSEIKKAKENCNIPIIGNGDIFKPGTAKVMLDQTGCDLAMIGRGSVGNPMIFKRVNHLLENQKNLPETTDQEKKKEFFKFLKYYEKYENNRAFTEIKQQAMWFTKEIKKSRQMRHKLMNSETVEEIKEIYDKYIV